VSAKKNLHFLSIQVDYWDSPWQNRHAFLSELSKKHKVFFLSPPFYLVDLLNKFAKNKTRMHGLQVIKENLYSYIPPRYLPFNYRFSNIDSFVKKIRREKIKKHLKNLNFEKPVLIIWHPNFADMIDEFGKSLVVYYKYDNYSGYIGGSGKADQREKKIFEKADLVFVTSRGLYDLHKSDCKDIHLLPNGVDYEFFSQSLAAEVVVPKDLNIIPQPRVGYVGVINEKVDFKLLIFLCKIHPEWSIVLIGPEKVKLDEFRKNLKVLKKQKNCYFLGQKDAKRIPAYIKGLDVCMMCYLVNDWTFYGYPLKMHEYLACGKPSISVDLPAVLEFENVISIARSFQEWSLGIELLLKNEEPSEKKKRMRVANANSWQRRAERLVDIIQKKMAD